MDLTDFIECAEEILAEQNQEETTDQHHKIYHDKASLLVEKVNFKKKEEMNKLYYKVSSESFKRQPDLVVEVLRQMFPQKPCSTSVKINSKNCNCPIKKLLKEFIRKTREDSLIFKLKTGN